jgi:hypothetical protein
MAEPTEQEDRNSRIANIGNSGDGKVRQGIYRLLKGKGGRVKMKKIRLLAVSICFIMAVMGVTALSADNISAVRSPQKIYVDGQFVDLLAFSINDNNYVRLRDVGKAVDFSVFYDASQNSVRIDRNARYAGGFNETLPTPPDNPEAAVSDNPIYVRGNLVKMTAYNIAGNNYVKLRDVGQAINLGMAYDPTVDAVYIDRQTAYLPNMEPSLLRPEAIPNQTAPPSETTTETPLEPTEPTTDGEVPERWKLLPEEYKAVEPFLAELKELPTDTARVNKIIRYVCERLEYGEPAPDIYVRVGTDSLGHETRSMRYAMFLDPPQVKGYCAHYSKAIYLLCNMANIPCDIITSYKDDHAWNVVYADNGWWIVDSTNDDSTLQYRGEDYNLLLPMDADLPFSDPDSEGTKAWMEQIVPGSTK